MCLGGLGWGWGPTLFCFFIDMVDQQSFLCMFCFFLQVFLVGHDWGALVGWDVCLLRPDRVKGYVAVSVPFYPRLADTNLLRRSIEHFGEGFYMNHFQVYNPIHASSPKSLLDVPWPYLGVVTLSFKKKFFESLRVLLMNRWVVSFTKRSKRGIERNSLLPIFHVKFRLSKAM